jgi:hypothetical protein
LQIPSKGSGKKREIIFEKIRVARSHNNKVQPFDLGVSLGSLPSSNPMEKQILRLTRERKGAGVQKGVEEK